MGPSSGDGWATPSDWASHRHLITALYRDQNKTLKETKRIMEEKHGFLATVRMYKARFQQWGIQKKIRAEDAVEIFRQQSARAAAGKSSVFYIGGCKINPDRLRRYRYRAHPMVSERIHMVEKKLAFAPETSPVCSRIVCRTPSPAPEDAQPISPRLDDPIDLRVPYECMQILASYIAGSIEAGVWQSSSTAPVPDAFTWAHYLATSQGLISHGRTKEGFALLSVCLAQYKTHLKNPDPFFWLATYKAALLLACRDIQLGNMFIKYASALTSTVLPSSHPFNHLWSKINQTGLHGLQQHAAALFESYLKIWKEQVGLLPPDQNRIVQMAFVFIQLQCSGMISYAFTREALEAMMSALSGSVYGQFLLQEAKFRMACLFLEQSKFDEADVVIGEILEWVEAVEKLNYKDYNHLRCKCLWTLFEIEDKRGNIDKATQTGERLVELCHTTYGRVHLQTIDAVSAMESYHRRNNNIAAADRLANQFDHCWTEFHNAALEKDGFPHTIEQPWLHRCIELKEDERLIQQVVDLLEQSSWLGES
jgi:hypothetical protein